MPWADTGGTFPWLKMEDLENYAKAVPAPSCPAQVQTSFLSSENFQKHPEDLRERRKATDNDPLPNMQVLTSCFQISCLGYRFSVSLDKGSCMLPPGLSSGSSGFLAAHRGLRHIMPGAGELLRCHQMLIWSLAVWASCPFLSLW